MRDDISERTEYRTKISSKIARAQAESQMTFPLMPAAEEIPMALW